MKTEKRSGPRIDPSGTEALMEEASEFWPHNTTGIDLSITQVALQPSQQHSRYTFGFEFGIEPIEPHLVKRTFYAKGLSRVAFQFCERMVSRSPVL